MFTLRFSLKITTRTKNCINTQKVLKGSSKAS